MRPRFVTAFSITVVLLAIIFAHYRGWLAPFENGARRVLSNTSQTIYALSQKWTNKPENLTARIEADQAANEAQVTLLTEENATLRAQLNFFASSTWKNVGANVIGRDIDPIGTTLVINAGTRSGISLNNPVVVGNGRLIGTIVRVDDTIAVVRLLNDPQSHIAATVLNRDHSLGLVEGGYGISVRLNFIPQSELVQPGNQILTSGLEPTMPRGLLIGTAETVEKKPQEPFQEAVLATAADLHNVTVVSVILYTRPI